jgi:hypothetical protein
VHLGGVLLGVTALLCRRLVGAQRDRDRTDRRLDRRHDRRLQLVRRRSGRGDELVGRRSNLRLVTPAEAGSQANDCKDLDQAS